MKKTKEQILRDCSNEHDRKLLIKGFNRWEKTHNKARILMLIATFFTLVGIAGLCLGNNYFLFSFIPVFPLLIWAQINVLNSVGLI